MVLTGKETTLSSLGMLRLGVASPELRVADVAFNTASIRALVQRAAVDGCRLLLLPELCLSGYSCGDLFQQPLLLERVRSALGELAEVAGSCGLALVVGAPLAARGRLFNCAVFLAGGRIVGAVPKSFLPNSREFYEERWFCSAAEAGVDHLDWDGTLIPFGNDLLFRPDLLPEALIGLELCEDLWVPAPPSAAQAQAGAVLLLNPSASPETLGKMEYRRDLVRLQSARCLAAYAYASAGPGESSTDLVFAGHSLIAENGQLLAETERFRFDTQLALADIDVERLLGERRSNNSFTAQPPSGPWRVLDFRLDDTWCAKLLRPVPAMPFVPADDAERSRRCHEIFALQTTALARRLRHTGTQRLVLGISGGLDSTLALLVTVRAFDLLGFDRGGIEAVTMPGFGTTARTRGNAERLAALLGVSLQVISIEAAVRQHFRDIRHDEQVHDVTFENAQARERTQILMDLANRGGALVLGTGDLSELALGWCTYNGDHMSMYGVNAGVPKTLVRFLVEWCATAEFEGEATTVLQDIAATPVSPELLPPTPDGEIRQVTEEQIGPYLLHDFFLYHVVRLQTPPVKLVFLARQAFAGQYETEVIVRWLRVFYRRFFSQQFKRSCLPDGPKVGSVALSPRGDWRMPSDASATLWLTELDQFGDET